MNSGIYIHIPFCRQGCKYCHFVTVPYREESIEPYVQAVIKEMNLYSESCQENMDVDSIYIGGGTPSLLPAHCIATILDACKHSFSIKSDCEISIEANPDTLDRNKVRIYGQNGINRLSIGAQSLQNRELSIIGRAHSAETVLETVKILKDSSLENINLDILLGLPFQTRESVQNTLGSIEKLDVPHLSVYMLDLEEPCPLSESVVNGSLSVPDDDIVANMYLETNEVLSSLGYHQYEISNYAIHNHTCLHNLKYWKLEPVIGFGLASHSFDGTCRYANFRNMECYLQSLHSCRLPVEWRRILQEKEVLQERLFLGLRMNEGVDWAKLRNDYSDEDLEKYEKSLRRFSKERLVEWRGTRVFLTMRGMLLSNEIFQTFV